MRLIARFDGRELPIDVERYAGAYRLTIDGREMEVDLVNAGPYVHSLRFADGSQFGFTHHRIGNEHEITLLGSKSIIEIVDPLALRRGNTADVEGEGGIVKALMPGRIVRLLVAQGDTVTKGSGLLILEAMKMENEIQAPSDGVIEELFVQAGETVDGGAPLVQIG